MRNSTQAPPTAGLVQAFIDSAYDNVKLVSDNLTAILLVADAIGEDIFLQSTDIDTLVKLNSVLTDATLLDAADLGTAAYEAIAAFATAVQGALADSALQPENIDSLSKLSALVLDEDVASEAYVDLAVVGLYDHKGAYNAATNTPDLDVTPSGIEKADAYTVSVAGTFFTVAVEAGDVLIADIDNAAVEADWTIVNRNIDSSAFATAAQGITADSATQPGDNISTLTNDSGFTGDQTGAEIKIAYEGELDTNALTDALLALLNSALQLEVVGIALSDNSTDLVTDTEVNTYTFPYDFTLVEVATTLIVAATGSLFTTDINLTGTGTILSTKITQDSGEKMSYDAVTPPVLSTTSFSKGDQLTFDRDAVGAVIAGQGHKIFLIGYQT